MRSTMMVIAFSMFTLMGCATEPDAPARDRYFELDNDQIADVLADEPERVRCTVSAQCASDACDVFTNTCVDVEEVISDVK